MKKGYKSSLEKLTLKNTQFRKVLYTAEHCQLVLMMLKPGEDIGLETHTEGDQFFRFESGEGRVVVNGKKYMVQGGDAVIVPAGAEHNITNTSMQEPLTLYTIYAPAHHKDGVVRKTKAAALLDAPEFDGATTEQ